MVAIKLCSGEGCNRALQPNQPNTFREVVVLEEVPTSGNTGRIFNRKPTGRQFCRACAEMPETDSLLEGIDSL